MSLTKTFDSYDGAGGSYDPELERWLEALGGYSEADLEAMAAQEEEYRRVKDAEAEVGPCGQREGW